MILVPKAIKGWGDSWGKGFARIYYVLAFIITFFMAFNQSLEEGDLDGFLFVILGAFFYLLAFIIFKVFTWVFGAFIKKK